MLGTELLMPCPGAWAGDVKDGDEEEMGDIVEGIGPNFPVSRIGVCGPPLGNSACAE